MIPILNAAPPQLERQRQEIMKALMDALTNAVPGVGMALFLFDPDGEGGRISFVSNVPREITTPAVRAWVDHQEGRVALPPAAAAVEHTGMTPGRAAFEAMVRAGLKLGTGHEGQGQAQKMVILARVGETVARAVLEAAAP